MADEGGEIVVFVVPGEDLIGESGNITDDEGIQGGGPAYYLFELRVLT